MALKKAAKAAKQKARLTLEQDSPFSQKSSSSPATNKWVKKRRRKKTPRTPTRRPAQKVAKRGSGGLAGRLASTAQGTMLFRNSSLCKSTRSRNDATPSPDTRKATRRHKRARNSVEVSKRKDDVLSPKKLARLSASPPLSASNGDEGTPVDLTVDPISKPAYANKSMVQTRKENMQAIANAPSKSVYRLVSMVAVSGSC